MGGGDGEGEEREVGRGRVRGEEEWREWESKRGGVGGKRKGRGHLMYRSWCYLRMGNSAIFPDTQKCLDVVIQHPAFLRHVKGFIRHKQTRQQFVPRQNPLPSASMSHIERSDLQKVL